MDVGTGAILIGVLIAVMIFVYMAQREKNAVMRKRRRKFSPQWNRKDDDGADPDGRTGRARRRRRT